MMLWLAFVSRASMDDWRRMSIVLLHVGVTFLPAGWASESASTLKALMNSGLEHRGLTQLKVDYLERYGIQGANPTARRWAVSYVLFYGAWTVFVVTTRTPFGLDYLRFSLLHAALVVALAVLVTWRIHRFTKTAETRGFPFGRLALELRRRQVRW